MYCSQALKLSIVCGLRLFCTARYQGTNHPLHSALVGPSWQQMVVGGGWQCLAVGGWWLFAGRSWAAADWWRDRLVAGWLLAVGGPWGPSLRAVFRKYKFAFLRTSSKWPIGQKAQVECVPVPSHIPVR